MVGGMKPILLPVISLLTCLATATAEPSTAPTDFLKGSGLSQFQPTSRWMRVAEVAAVEGKKEITVSGDGPILVNDLTKDTSIPYLFTRQSFGDVKVSLEFMIPKDSNAGIYLMGRYEVQIFDSFGKAKVGSADMGGIYASWEKTKPKEQQWWGGTAPKVNAATAPGSWQTMDIMFRAPRFDSEGKKTKDALFETVHLNGQLVQENTSATDPTASHPLPGEVHSGPIVIQGDHGPIAIRRFTATPLPSAEHPMPSEIDAYWAEVSRSVHEGDFDAYSATYHPDAVIVAGSKQSSYPIRQALQRWQSDFTRTKAKEVASQVEFRFSHRYRDASTAHEAGIFCYTSQLPGQEAKHDYISFEALLVKKDGKWQMMMEYQKGPATKEAWDQLED